MTAEKILINKLHTHTHSGKSPESVALTFQASFDLTQWPILASIRDDISFSASSRKLLSNISMNCQISFEFVFLFMYLSGWRDGWVVVGGQKLKAERLNEANAPFQISLPCVHFGASLCGRSCFQWILLIQL